jgi:phosphatidylcholine synthase
MEPMRNATAWAVHAYTASGALMGLAGVLAVVAGDFRQAFIWMFVATFVDGTDGWLSRLVRVKERTPAFDGARLDDIVDYLTFVFLPAFLIVMAGLVPEELKFFAAGAMLLSSAYGFASLDAKTSDDFFTGFPSYWNIVALYLAVLGLSPWVNAAVIIGFALMVFVRIGYVYPTRTRTLRTLTLALMGLWGLMLLAMIAMLPAPPRWLVLASLAFPVYYTVLSLTLNARRSRAAR